jgi:hypothetical protein
MINSTTATDRTTQLAAVAALSPKTPRPPTQRSDQLSTENAAYLHAALARQPEIRPEVVERAKNLAADPNYPSAATLQRVGQFILNSPDLTEDQS